MLEIITIFFYSNLTILYLIIFASFLGYELISKVPSVLHTPLMSGSNAISGIVIIGAILLIRKTNEADYLSLFIGSCGIVLGSINVVGGFMVTNKMLNMFKKNKRK